MKEISPQNLVKMIEKILLSSYKVSISLDKEFNTGTNYNATHKFNLEIFYPKVASVG